MQGEVIRVKERDRDCQDNYSMQVSGASIFSGFCVFILLLLMIVLIVMVARTNELLKNMVILKLGRSRRM